MTMVNTGANSTLHKQPRGENSAALSPRNAPFLLWAWRPLRVAGRNRIAICRGQRVIMLMHAHDLDDAHALVQLRNLASVTAAR